MLINAKLKPIAIASVIVSPRPVSGSPEGVGNMVGVGDREGVGFVTMVGLGDGESLAVTAGVAD